MIDLSMFTLFTLNEPLNNMNPFDEFLAMNPDASYEDFIKMQDLMNQDIMSSTLPIVDMEALTVTPQFSPVEGSSIPAELPAIVPAIDMFGNPHFVNPMDVDIMSGLPSSSFHISQPSFTGSEPVESYEQWRLDKGNEIEAMRDTAVQHYKDAKAAGDIDEMLKWEAEANKQQGRLYDHWGTPTYGLPPKAPGID